MKMKETEGVESTPLIFDYCNKAMDQIVQGQIHKGTLKRRKRKL